jgi:hypothetical protein
MTRKSHYFPTNKEGYAVVRQYKLTNQVVILFPELPFSDAQFCAAYIGNEGHAGARYISVMSDTIICPQAEAVLALYNAKYGTNYVPAKRRSAAMLNTFHANIKKLNEIASSK